MAEKDRPKTDFEILRERYPFMDDEDIWAILDGPGGLDAFLKVLDAQEAARKEMPMTREEWEREDERTD